MVNEGEVDEYVDDSGDARLQMTFGRETVRFLLDSYPDARNLQEAARSAISDARLVRDNGEVGEE
jgi:hypothetical protein